MCKLFNIVTGLIPPLGDIVLFGLSLKVFKTRLLERGFHTLIKNTSFSSLNDVGSHNPLGAQRPGWHSFPFPINMGSSNPIHPPLEPNILTGTQSYVHPLWGSTSSLTHRPVSGSDIICNSPSSLLTDIVLFEFSLLSFPSRFLKCIC